MKLPIKPDRRKVEISGDMIPSIEVREHPENEHVKQVRFSRGLLEAAAWINNGLTEFKTSARAGEMIGDRWDTHPERRAIDQWLSIIGADEDGPVVYFASAHVLAEWLSIPARTMKEHRNLYKQIDETAKQLALLLAATEERYYRGGGHGLRQAVVCELFTEQEMREVFDVVEAWNETHGAVVFEDGMPSHKPAIACFPQMEDLLERIALAAKRLGNAGPLHSQPNKKGAMNGYFIRRMDGLLRQRYGKYPAEVLASIASIVLDAVIDADLVKKTVSLSERSKSK